MFFPGGEGSRASSSWSWLQDVRWSDWDQGHNHVLLPAGRNLGIHPSVTEQRMNFFPHPNPEFPTGKSSHRVWVCFAAAGSLKLGSALLSGRGFCSFLPPGEVLKIPQHFRVKALLFSPVLTAWAGGEYAISSFRFVDSQQPLSHPGLILVKSRSITAAGLEPSLLPLGTCQSASRSLWALRAL